MAYDINSSPVLDKKIERAGSYGDSCGLRNLTCDEELKVTITLDEYRYLVTQNATKEEQVKKAEADRYERNQENEKLRKENDALKTELYELKKKFDEATVHIEATGTFATEIIS